MITYSYNLLFQCILYLLLEIFFLVHHNLKSVLNLKAFKRGQKRLILLNHPLKRQHRWVESLYINKNCHSRPFQLVQNQLQPGGGRLFFFFCPRKMIQNDKHEVSLLWLVVCQFFCIHPGREIQMNQTKTWYLRRKELVLLAMVGFSVLLQRTTDSTHP